MDSEFRHVKQPLNILLILLAATAAPLAIYLAMAPEASPARQQVLAGSYEESIFDARTGRDRPRPIENPQYIASADAGLTLEPADVVFVVRPEDSGGRATILPQRIMVHHEIANLEFEERKAVVVYSPLAGMARGFIGQVDGARTGFGTTGLYLNSIRLIYDRASGSIWLPLHGTAVQGPLAGAVLEGFDVAWTTWEKAGAAYPDARVLAGGALVDANYSRDPYGSYLLGDTYYQKGGSYFPLMNTDQRLKPKEVVVAPASGSPKLAFVKDAVARDAVVNVEHGITRVVAFHDPELGGVRLFEPYSAGRELTFGFKNGVIFDHQTRSKWSPEGEAVEGRLRGRTLTPIESMQLFWFAWSAFYPDSLSAGK